LFSLAFTVLRLTLFFSTNRSKYYNGLRTYRSLPSEFQVLFSHPTAAKPRSGSVVIVTNLEPPESQQLNNEKIGNSKQNKKE